MHIDMTLSIYRLYIEHIVLLRNIKDSFNLRGTCSLDYQLVFSRNCLTVFTVREQAIYWHSLINTYFQVHICMCVWLKWSQWTELYYTASERLQETRELTKMLAVLPCRTKGSTHSG